MDNQKLDKVLRSHQLSCFRKLIVIAVETYAVDGACALDLRQLRMIAGVVSQSAARNDVNRLLSLGVLRREGDDRLAVDWSYFDPDPFGADEEDL